MNGVFLPGDSTAQVRRWPLADPSPGQLLLKMSASGICGSDIGYIYHGYKTHKGLDGAPAYRAVVAGHEPAGRVIAVGEGVRRFGVGDDVIVYHIHGCGVCRNCRGGYYVSCSDASRRAAYGWQRDGGHAEFILVDETEAIPLLAPLTPIDGALIACGFGTAYEGLLRTNLDGSDTLLVVGLGPVGLAAAIIGRLFGARRVVGVEMSPARRNFAGSLEVMPGTPVLNEIVEAGPTALEQLLTLTSEGGFSVAVDCSGSTPGRRTAIAAASEWGRVALIGEGGTLETEVSDDLLHKHLTVTASWVTSLQGMEELTRLLAAARVHPEIVVSDRLTLSRADEAYRLAAGEAAGKVVLVPDTSSDAL